MILEKLEGLSDRHSLKIQRPWFSADDQREVTLGVLKEYIAASSQPQPLDSDLTALAALTTTGILRRTGSGTASAGTTVAIAEGGTGATTAATALTSLGAASTANWKSGAGAPATAGTRGDVYRDTANGQLYVYGTTTTGLGWTQVAVNQTAGSGKFIGQVLTVDAASQSVFSHSIVNNRGIVMAWNANQGISILGFTDDVLSLSANFDNRQLHYPETVYPAIDWYDGMLFDKTASISLEFDARSLTVTDDLGSLVSTLSWASPDGVELIGQPYDNGMLLLPCAPRIKNNINSTTAIIGAFKTFILTSGATHNLPVTAGNDILIALDYTSATSPITLNLGPMIDGLVGGGGDGNIGAGNEGTEARIQIFSKLAVASLTLNFTRSVGNAYQFVGAAIGSIAANGCHELRVSGLKIYHVR